MESYRGLMNIHQTRRMAKINKLKKLQQEVRFWEQKQEKYEKSLKIFKKYIDCIKEFNNPKALINAYIRMGQYCESMGDNFFAENRYRLALKLEKTFKIDKAHIKNLKSKISRLSW